MRQYYSLQLIGICIIIFIFQSAYPILTDTFLLSSENVASQPWLLITSIFLHGSIMHLAYNMLSLAIFGTILESTIGSRKFLVVFFASGIIASAVAVNFYPAVLGASGAVFGIIGTLAALRPRMVVWAIGVPMPLIIAAGVWLLFDLMGVFYPANVANMAHISGLAFGMAIGLTLFKNHKMKRSKKVKSFMSDKDFDYWENEYMDKKQ